MPRALDLTDLDRNGTTRLLEFFDEDVEAAYAFICNVWMPNFLSRLRELGNAVGSRRPRSALYLADHLRDSARTIGAHVLASRAPHVERGVSDGDWGHAAYNFAELYADFRRLAEH